MAHFGDILSGLAPPIGLGILFVIVLRAILQADRRERRAQQRAEALEQAEILAEHEGSANSRPAGHPLNSEAPKDGAANSDASNGTSTKNNP